MAGGETNEVLVIYSSDDGKPWSVYIVDLLKNIERTVVNVVDMNNDGQLSPVVVNSDSTVIVLVSSPGFISSLINSKSTNFDRLLQPCRQISPGAADLVVLFLCGTTLSDFNELDKGKQPLSQRLQCLSHWTLVTHDQCAQLPQTVCKLLQARPKHKTHKPPVVPVKPKCRKTMEFQLIPAEAKCEESTLMMLSFTDSRFEREEDMKMHVEIVSETLPDDERAAPVKAVVYWVNCHTGYFMAPPNVAGNATVKVVYKGHSVGSQSITYRAMSSEATIGVIQILLHQMDKLCNLLLVERRLPSVDEVDRLLSGVFQDDPVANEIPTVAFEKFMEPYRFIGDTDEPSSVELPSPLHFAAKYGLSELSSKLLDLPDARSAYAIPNSSNHHPEDLARAGHHSTLATVLENFREVGVGFDAIYMAYVNSTEKGSKKSSKKTVRSKSPPLYLDMSGRKADDGDDESSASSYEEIHSPVQRQRILTPEPPTEPLLKTTQISPVRPILSSKPTALALSSVRTSEPPAATTAAAATAATSEPLGSQQELLSILQQVKHNELTMAQAEVLFQEWQMRFQNGPSASFKQKQQQLAQMRVEVQQVKESNLGVKRFFNTFRHGKNDKKEIVKAAKAGKITDTDAKGPQKPRPVLALQPDSPRNSSTSCSSRDSTASRSSTTSSGVDTEMPMMHNLPRVCEEMVHAPTTPETPPIPPRKGADATYDCYIKLISDDTQQEEYVDTDQLHHMKFLPEQMSMPETSAPPWSTMPRKQSCPEAVIAAQTGSTLKPVPSAGRARSPVPPEPSVPKSTAPLPPAPRLSKARPEPVPREKPVASKR